MRIVNQIKAYREGEKAFEENVKESPYVRGSELDRHWLNGYNDAWDEFIDRNID